MIECYGNLDPNVLSMPGSRVTSGTVTCTLGLVTPFGLTILDTFSSTATAYVRNTEDAPGLNHIVAEVVFQDGSRTYALGIDDYATNGYLAMVNPEDHIADSGAGPYRYNVRAGYLKNRCGFCLVDALLSYRSFHVVAEYVFDLPVG